MAGATKALSSISVFVELSGFSDISHPLPLPHPCLSILWVAQTVFSDTIYILLGGERATTTNWEIEVSFPIILHNHRVARLNHKATSSPTLLCYFNCFINWWVFFTFFSFLLALFVVNITSISSQRLAARKQRRGIGGNAPELDLIFHPSRYEPSEITWNRTDGKCQNWRRKCTICDGYKIKYSCTRLTLRQSNWSIYLTEHVICVIHPYWLEK